MTAVDQAADATVTLSGSEVANLLDEMARRLELVGVSKFKVRAYENAAANLRTLLEVCSSRESWKRPAIRIASIWIGAGTGARLNWAACYPSTPMRTIRGR